MKTVGQMVMILIAALLVIGATYALSQTTAVSALVGQPMGVGASEDQFTPAGFANGQNAPAGEMRGGEREEQGGSFETVWRNFLEVAAITVAVQVVWSIRRRIKREAERRNRWRWSRSS